MQKKTSAQKNQLAAEPADAPEPVSGGVEVAAREALELAEEAMTYVSDHFRKKWSMDERRAKIAAALSQLEAEAEGEQEAVVRWVAFHTDQHVVRPEPFERGMNFVVQSREAAEDLARILNAQPPSADLVAAAREVSSLEGRSIAQITGWLAKPRDTRRYIKVGCDPLLRLAAALQNTPEVDDDAE